MKKKFVAIGHITNDTEPTDHLGGSVAYLAVAAKRLGLEAHIITKSPPKHPYITQLKKLGITVHSLPSSLATITTFKNSYDQNGRRIMLCLSQQEHIGEKDFSL